jgi:hypothetical protein
VARVDPHVNVGGLLEQTILDKPLESCMNGSHDILSKEEHVRESTHKMRKVGRILGHFVHIVTSLTIL